YGECFSVSPNRREQVEQPRRPGRGPAGAVGGRPDAPRRCAADRTATGSDEGVERASPSRLCRRNKDSTTSYKCRAMRSNKKKRRLPGIRLYGGTTTESGRRSS